MKKKILSGCLIAASMLVATSCSDFLTENPQGQLTPETFFATQSDLDMSVYALYAKVQAFQCNSNPMIVQCQGDDMTSTTGSNKAAYLSADAYETPTDTKGIEQLWSRLYTVIQAANLIIDNAANVSTTEEEINIALGQAYYWRAFSYFSLVRIYGPLPMNLHNLPDNNETTLTPVAEVYEQIVSDLTAAENCDLPAKYTGTNRVIDGENIYVSAQTVKATLAAVYMSMAGYPLNQTSYYTTAAAKAKEVIDGVNNGTYDQALRDDWDDVYSYALNHHNETLLGIDYNSTVGGWSDGDSQFSSCHQLNTLSGWGDFLPERRYWKNYPDGPRKDAVFAKQLLLADGVTLVDWWATTDGQPYDGSNAVVGDYRPMYVSFTVNTDLGAYDYTKPFWTGMCINKRHQLIRYSEVLLWYAESAARAGQDLTAAKSALKQVRARAYSDQSAVDEVDGMSASELAEAAYVEHGYEVAGYALAMVTRRADEFRMERLKEGYDYRTSSQSEVLVPKGTLTHSRNAAGEAFTYELTEDLVLSENMSVTATWNGESSIYQDYPPTEVEANPNLDRSLVN
ncbi:MAG: RagB/SusD family nutrient uptake outer membrane protein [Bacteroides sp.]|nr:RagB/SusD family nutrient uptake outer membrane protein [Bacteroides sp.]